MNHRSKVFLLLLPYFHACLTGWRHSRVFARGSRPGHHAVQRGIRRQRQEHARGYAISQRDETLNQETEMQRNFRNAFGECLGNEGFDAGSHLALPWGQPQLDRQAAPGVRRQALPRRRAHAAGSHGKRALRRLRNLSQWFFCFCFCFCLSFFSHTS